MKYYEKVLQETDKLVKTTCDKCENEIPSVTGHVREFELTFGVGQSDPEGGYIEGWQVEDLCDTCAKWLKEILTHNGVRISDMFRDW